VSTATAANNSAKPTVGAAKPYEISWLPRVLNDALDEFRIGIGYQTGQRLDGVRVTFGVPF